MNRIIVKSGSAVGRTIPARGDRAAITFKEQQAAIECGEDFPQPFKINLAEDQPPYPPGEYLLDVSSLQVNEYGGLKMARRIALVPLPPALAKAEK